VFTTDVLTGNSEIIDGLSAEWAELCEEGPCNEPFLRPEWFSTFVKNFENEIDIITVRRDGKLRAILPVISKRGQLHGIPVRKLQAVYNLNTQRFDLIHGADKTEKASITKMIWESLRDRSPWDVFEAKLVKRDSWLAEVLMHAAKENHKTGIWEMDSAPYIALPEPGPRSLEDFFQGSRKHLRQELDRRLRRLKEVGAVEFVVTSTVTPELMTTYFELESKGWKGRRGTAVTDDPVVARVHHEFAEKMVDQRTLFVYELKLDGRTIAMSLNIRDEGRTTHWKTSYDEEYARYSPGNLLFRELLKDCIRDGSPEIDFLSPSTPNKRAWASGEREHVGFYIFRRGLFGSLLSMWKFSAVAGMRNFKLKVPPTLAPTPAHK